jgi:hypothetical protein
VTRSDVIRTGSISRPTIIKAPKGKRLSRLRFRSTKKIDTLKHSNTPSFRR